ncbi:mCG19080, isoform CRA_a, partial [Mus musculus]
RLTERGSCSTKKGTGILNQRETYAQKNMSLDCFPTAVECLEHWSLDTNFKKTSWMAVQSYEPQFPLYIFFTPARLLSGSDQR